MLAEAAHSWADTGNEVLLFIAGRRSVQPPDDQHPVGYGREAYVWALFAGFGLFGVGSIVSIMHGIQELIHPEPATDYLVSYTVLAVGVRARGGLVPAGLAPGEGQGRDDRVRGAGPRPAHVRPDPACGVLRGCLGPGRPRHRLRRDPAPSDHRLRHSRRRRLDPRRHRARSRGDHAHPEEQAVPGRRLRSTRASVRRPCRPCSSTRRSPASASCTSSTSGPAACTTSRRWTSPVTRRSTPSLGASTTSPTSSRLIPASSGRPSPSPSRVLLRWIRDSTPLVCAEREARAPPASLRAC